MGYSLPGIHVLHTQDDISSFVLEGSVESHNVRGVTVMADLQFAQDLLSDVLLGIDADNLKLHMVRGQRREGSEEAEAIPFEP